MKRKMLVLIQYYLIRLTAVTTVTVAAHASAQTLDQYNPVPPFIGLTESQIFNNPPGENVNLAQVFTVGLPGTLSDISVVPFDDSSLGLPMTVAILTTTNGIPNLDGNLGYIDIPADEVPPRGVIQWVTSDFSSFNIQVTPGEQLAIDFYTADRNGYFVVGADTDFAPPYPGGDAYESAFGGGFHDCCGGQMAFKTFVNTPPSTPEPGSLALLFAGMLVSVAAFVDRRHRHQTPIKT